MKWIGLVCVAAVAGAMGLAAGESQAHTLDTLQFTGYVTFTEQTTTATTCPAGTPDTTACFPTTGTGVIPGLGQVTESYSLVRDQYETACNHAHFTGSLTASKGEIDFSADNPGCVHAQDNFTTFAFTITGGSGAYAGATGTGTIAKSYSSGPGGRDTWTGSVTVPGLTFDTTPPALTGATSKIAKTTSKTGARVHFSVTATDAVDGAVPVTCAPKSGSLFPLGRTTVTCIATDTSGNSSTAHFTITITHTHH